MTTQPVHVTLKVTTTLATIDEAIADEIVKTAREYPPGTLLSAIVDPVQPMEDAKGSVVAHLVFLPAQVH